LVERAVGDLHRIILDDEQMPRLKPTRHGVAGARGQQCAGQHSRHQPGTAVGLNGNAVYRRG
jgi:hypothetical protein